MADQKKQKMTWQAKFLIFTFLLAVLCPAASIGFGILSAFIIAGLSGTSSIKFFDTIFFRPGRKYIVIFELPNGYLATRYFTTLFQILIAGKIGKTKHVHFGSRVWLETKVTFFPKADRTPTPEKAIFRYGNKLSEALKEIMSTDPLYRSRRPKSFYEKLFSLNK